MKIVPDDAQQFEARSRTLKRNLLVVVLVVAIMALVAPVLAFAGSSGTTTVTGRLGVAIEVTAPSAIAFGNFTIGVNSGSSATPGTVTTNATSWSVTAKDQNGTDHSGCMMLSGSNCLSGMLQISSSGSNYTGAATGITYDNNPTTLPLYVQQNVKATDTRGDYTITIVFTASGS